MESLVATLDEAIRNGKITAPFRIVSIIEHKGRLILATERQLFELVDGAFRPMVFVYD